MENEFAVRSSTSGRTLAARCRRAASLRARLVGLLGVKSLEPGAGLLIERCRMVHMFGMRFPIDAVFCSGDGSVLLVAHRLRPWSVSPYVPSAEYVIEVAAGAAESAGIEVGERLEFETAQKPSSASVCGKQRIARD